MFYYVGYPSVEMSFNSVSVFITSHRAIYYILWFPASIAAIVTFNLLCKNVSKIYSFPVLRAIGRNAITIYVSHQIVIFIAAKLLLKINPKLTDSDIIIYYEIAALAIFLPLIIILKKHITRIPSISKLIHIS